MIAQADSFAHNLQAERAKISAPNWRGKWNGIAAVPCRWTLFQMKTDKINVAEKDMIWTVDTH